MAGLLDIFGTGGGESLGLLGGNIEQSRNDAQAQALYALAGSLLSGGPTGQSIVRGLQQGSNAYRDTMKGATQDQMQLYQLQELKRKQAEEQAAKARQQRIDQAVAGAYQPSQAAIPGQMVEEDGRYIGETPGTEGRAAGFDFQRLAPALLASPEGRKTLSELMAAQKTMQGETFSLAEGAQQYQRDPLTGAVKLVASGAPKVAKLTGKEGNAALMLFGTDSVDQLRNIPGAVDRIRSEATIQRKAEQPQINLADPTAVQTQQLKTINQWEGVLKDSGAAETANRAQGFYAAYGQAKKGNTNADGAMIYNLAKVYDPAGAVQAGDISTVLGSKSVPENIKSYAQKLTTGGTLTPKERENMKKIIDDVVTERKRMIEPSLKTYRGINSKLNGDESAIYNPFDDVKQPKSLEEILGIPQRPRGGN